MRPRPLDHPQHGPGGPFDKCYGSDWLGSKVVGLTCVLGTYPAHRRPPSPTHPGAPCTNFTWRSAWI